MTIDTGRGIIDTFGNLWPSHYDLCPTCGQPDNCGDCNHEPITRDQVLEIGGIPSRNIYESKDGALAIERVVNPEAWIVFRRNGKDTTNVEFLTSSRYGAESFVRGYDLGCRESEKQLAELTAAIKRNTERLKQLIR